MRVLFAFMMLLSATAQSSTPLRFSDLAGWWSADPEYGGEKSRVVLHLVEEQGKPTARLSIVAIGGYDFPLGAVTVAGDSIDSQPFSFPLRYDAARDVLSGYLPQDAVPVYRIAVEFHRSAPHAQPEPPRWQARRPTVRWSVDTGSSAWAGLERDGESGFIFVGNDGGTLHAIDATGAIRWKFATGKPIKARPAVIGDSVYVSSDSGFLYRLDKLTGGERWRVAVDSGSPARIPASEENSRWDRYGSSVVADARCLYYASRDRHLYAIDIATGRETWRVAAGDLVVAAGDLVVADDRVLVGSRTYELIALDAASGKEQWKHYYWFSWIESPPVVRDDVVYTGSSDATQVFAIGLADGRLRWKTSVPGWAWSRLAVNDDLVIAGTAGVVEYPGMRSGSLVALDRRTGALRWLYLDPPSRELADAKKGWGFGASPLIVGGCGLRGGSAWKAAGDQPLALVPAVGPACPRDSLRSWPV